MANWSSIWIVLPHANAGDLSIPVSGSDRIQPEDDGSLRICAGQACIVKHRPVAWQDLPDGRRFVDVSHAVEGNSVRLAIGKHDAAHTLIVVPVLTWLSLLGGTGDEIPGEIEAAPDGGAYLFFSSLSPSFNYPTAASAVAPALKTGHQYAVLVKLSPDGAAIEKTAYFGATGTKLPPLWPWTQPAISTWVARLWTRPQRA